MELRSAEGEGDDLAARTLNASSREGQSGIPSCPASQCALRAFSLLQTGTITQIYWNNVLF